MLYVGLVGQVPPAATHVASNAGFVAVGSLSAPSVHVTVIVGAPSVLAFWAADTPVGCPGRVELGDGVGLGLGDGVGLGLGDGVGLGLGDGVGLGLGDGVGLADGLADGLGLGDGPGRTSPVDTSA